IPKNPSGKSCAGAESFRKLLPFVDYLVDVGPNEFRKTHQSFPGELYRAGVFLLELVFSITPTAARKGKAKAPPEVGNRRRARHRSREKSERFDRSTHLKREYCRSALQHKRMQNLKDFPE
ncbi:MAG: hypothetical protein ACREF8_01810, partial [Chthoniobacterales bacterium]